MLRSSSLQLARPLASAAAMGASSSSAACVAPCAARRLWHSAAPRFTAAAAAAPAAPAASMSVRVPSAPKPPSRTAILATYRALRRGIFQTFYTSSQYASFNELAGDQDSLAGRSPGAAYRKKHFAMEENKPHVQFARKRSEQWLKLIKQGYSDHAGEKDPAALARLHRHAEELSALLVSNMEHSRYLLEGGWGIRRDNSKTLTNVAHKVGLQMPKEVQHQIWEPAGNKHHKARDAVLNKDEKFVR